jgi:hypothetical protein
MRRPWGRVVFQKFLKFVRFPEPALSTTDSRWESGVPVKEGTARSYADAKRSASGAWT